MICLVRVEVWEWRDSVWVGVELRGGVGRGGGCVAKRVATNIVGIDACTARAMCRQGDVLVVCVKFRPFYLFIIIKFVPPLAGKFPHEEANDTHEGNAACNRQSDDGGTGNTRRAATWRTSRARRL